MFRLRLKAIQQTMAACLIFISMGIVGATASNAAPPANTAKAVESAIREGTLKKHVSFLADDGLKGRDSGTPGGREAAQYIRKALADLGLQPLGDTESDGSGRSFLQRLSMDGPVRLTESDNFLETHVEDGVIEYQVQQQFLPFSFSASAATGPRPVVFASYGASEARQDYDDYAGVDVKGKIVVAFRYDRTESSAEPYRPQPSAYLVTKARKAWEKGAAGLVIVNGPQSKNAGEGDPLFGLGLAGRWDNPGLPVVHAKRSFLDQLLEGSGKTSAALQRSLDDNQEPVSFVIPNRRVSLAVSLKREKLHADNVVAMLEGSDPDLKHEVVVIGAHYDHVGLGSFGSAWGSKGAGQIHNGADDNASGTAAVMEIAAAFSSLENRPRRSLVFILFAGEERGLLGSRYFLDHCPFPKENIVAMINADMIGRSEDGKLTISGVGTGDGFRELVLRNNAGLDLKIETRKSGEAPSDHANFYRDGIPVLFYFTGLHKQYHTPDDDVALINFADQAKICRHMFRVALELANLKQRPGFIGS